MKHRTPPKILAAIMFAVALIYVLIRPQSSIYLVTDIGQGLPAESYAFAVNADGQVAGYTDATGDKKTQGFVYSAGRIKALSAPTLYSQVYGINAGGIAVGRFYNKEHVFHACRFDDDKIQDLGTLGGRSSEAYAVNAAGQTVGVSITGDRKHHAFLYDDGHMQDLGTLGGPLSIAHAINDAGQIVGTSWTDEDCNHAFFYSEGSMKDMGTLGGACSYAYAINALGEAVGNSDTFDGRTHAFFYSNGAMRDLGTLPSGTDSYAYGLNKQGNVVGSADTGNGQAHAFVFKNGRMKDLNSLIPARSGWILTEAHAINDKGEIVGIGSFNGKTHAFLLIPTK